MSSAIVTMTLTVAVHAFGLGHSPSSLHHDQNGCLNIVPPGPGLGWGFPNGAIDGYGWVDYGYLLPLGADRTPEYYFPRFLSVPPARCFPRRITTASRPAASGIYPIAGMVETTRWADRRRLPRTCQFHLIRPT